MTTYTVEATLLGETSVLANLDCSPRIFPNLGAAMSVADEYFCLGYDVAIVPGDGVPIVARHLVTTPLAEVCDERVTEGWVTEYLLRPVGATGDCGIWVPVDQIKPEDLEPRSRAALCGEA